MQPSKATFQSFRFISSLLYLGVLAASLYYQVIGLCGLINIFWRMGGLAASMLVLVCLGQWQANRYGLYPPPRLAVLLLAGQMILFEGVIWVDCSGFAKFLYLIVPFAAYFSLGKKVSYGLGLFYLGLFVARLAMQSDTWYMNEAYMSDLLIFAIGLVFALSMARVIRDEERSRTQAERLLGELETSHQQLQAYAQEVAQLAAAEERNRLARDIHDSLGHYLTVILIQLEKALAFRQRDAQEADQAIHHARRSAKQALADVRQSVGTLRRTQADFSLEQAVEALVTGMRNGRLAITCHIEGEEAGFSPLILMALYRAAQEGLTNIQKHAQASQVTLQVWLEAQQARLCLQDDGRGFETAVLAALQAEQAGHFGLQGVQERLTLVGGDMKIESIPGEGTCLWVTVPKDRARKMVNGE